MVMLTHMRRMQPAAARAMGHSARVPFPAASAQHLRFGTKLSAVQFIVPTHASSFGARRSFSSTPVVSGLADDDKVVAMSPVEAAQQALETASGAIEYSNVADLGFGLSDIAIRSLDVIHATTGLPWWATIIATTFAVRTVFFPITVISMRNSAKMKAFQPDMEKLKAEMDLNPQKDPNTVKEFQTKYKALMKKHDVNPFLGMITPMSQIPVFLGFFWGLQEIAKYFPEYSTEGTLWFNDLSAADPTLALPVISSALMVASVELGGEALPEDYKDQVKFGMRALAVVMIPITMNFSSGIFVYWVSSNLFTVVQTAALRVNAIKRVLKIPVQETHRIPVTATTNLSPFQAAVSRAKEGTTIQTHMHKPIKKNNQKKNN
uniref:Membrane insertase YidC/Oxa/ALB C-terminal domain-containing protein n=1 Tax=Globisporangium ultimum (strain ATCC 200006 / CBS 805.95 / DAOM BR144) TaxID=431595 RepID=K3WL12_GLOUD